LSLDAAPAPVLTCIEFGPWLVRAIVGPAGNQERAAGRARPGAACHPRLPPPSPRSRRMAAGSSARSSKLTCPLGLRNSSVASRGSGVQLAPAPVIEDPWRGQLQRQVRKTRNRLPAGARQQPEPAVRRPLQRCV